MMVTPLGQLILDLVEISDRYRFSAPGASKAVRNALLRFDPETENQEHIRALRSERETS